MKCFPVLVNIVLISAEEPTSLAVQLHAVIFNTAEPNFILAVENPKKY